MAHVETLMLANHAEAINGLLYIQGGAWTHHWRPRPMGENQAPPSQIAIAATFLIEAREVSREHSLSLSIASEDGAELFKAEGNVQVNPATGTEAPTYRTAIAANVLIGFPNTGRYGLSGAIDSQAPSVVDFWVGDAPAEGQPSSEGVPTGGYI